MTESADIFKVQRRFNADDSIFPGLNGKIIKKAEQVNEFIIFSKTNFIN